MWLYFELFAKEYKITGLIITLVMCVSLLTAWCKKSDLDVQSKFGTFILVEEEGIRGSYVNQYIMYDPDTMVMYSYLEHEHAAGLTVMYNADGTLKLYSPEGAGTE